MSYAKVEDVVALFRNLDIEQIDAAITEDEIETFLEDAEARINTRLLKFYTLPIDADANPKSFRYLATIEKYFAAAVVDEILNNYAEGERRPTWEKKALQMLEEIAPQDCDTCKPASLLPDADFLGNSTSRGRFAASSVEISPVFERGKNNW